LQNWPCRTGDLHLFIECSNLMEANMKTLTTLGYSRLAAAVFAFMAVVQLGRAVMGIDVVLGTMSMPIWVSLLAAGVGGILAWLGVTAKGT
jgi:hypothetical protein